MIKFDKGEFVSNPGDPKHVIYKPKVGKDGIVDLVEAGYENTDEIIQSYAESTDIMTIMNRVSNGEFDLLQARNGIYGDFTGMPKTYAEALQLHIDANRLFASLPADVRQKFDNDENQFFAAAGTAEWAEKLEGILPDEMSKIAKQPDAEINPVPEKEVKV